MTTTDEFVKSNIHTLYNWIAQLEDNLKEIKSKVIAMEELLNK